MERMPPTMRYWCNGFTLAPGLGAPGESDMECDGATVAEHFCTTGNRSPL